MKAKVKARSYKVYYDFGYNAIYKPEETLITICSNGNYIDKTAIDLSIRDFVAVRRNYNIKDEQKYLSEYFVKKKLNGNAIDVSLPEFIDKDFSYLLGLLIGDGGLTTKNVVNLTTADDEIKNEFFRIINKYNLKCRHTPPYGYSVCSVIFKDIFVQIEMNKYSYEKTVPTLIKETSKENIKYFLMGLFDTDGYSSKRDGYVGYASTSELLINDVQFLLLNFGILSKRRIKKTYRRDCYEIMITGRNALKFYNEIGFKLSRKMDNIKHLPIVNNTNVDIIPNISEVIRMARKSSSHKKSVLKTFYDYEISRRMPSYEKLDKLFKYLVESEYKSKLLKIYNDNYYWSKVVKIEEL